VIVLDTSGLLSAIDKSQNHHGAAARALGEAAPPLLLSPFVLAELDYLLATRVGRTAELSLLAEVADGAYQLEPFGGEDVAQAREHISRYGNVELGLADASIIVLADRYGVSDLLSLDERHFRTVRRANGQPFRLLPADLLVV
jgi:predicted nucleic acid-binding protein